MSRSARISQHENHALARQAASYTINANGLKHSSRKEQDAGNDEFPHHRPSKRRKLEIRSARQSTLDGFFSSNPVKPPVSIAPLQPHGPLIETVNGVHRDLAVKAEDILVDSTIGTADAPPKAVKRLKTAPVDKKEDKRTLRSQDHGPRLKSELATYFNNYEEIIFDTPREEELLNVDSLLYIADDVQSRSGISATPSPAKSKATQSAPRRVSGAASGTTNPGSSSAADLDLSPILRALPDNPHDPLTDAAFMVSHRRAERKEKQMRNIERAHAMHEKAQLEGLLEGLLGHDWLRVLGITGVTESEAKKFEPKREYFIDEVRGLVDKFNAWKDEEKRQKLEREAMLAAEREADAVDDESTESSSGFASSELNLSASRQLQQEAARSLQAARAKKKEQRQGMIPPSPAPYHPPSPITSFYPSRHLRESALKKTRNSRNVTAFGVPLPELDEREFALPDDYLTADVLRASARERRRKNREAIANAAAAPP